MTAQLFEGEYFKKFLQGANAPWGPNKALGQGFHLLLPLAHGVGEMEPGAMRKQNALLVEKAGCNPQNFSPRLGSARAPGPHHAGISTAKDQAETGFCQAVAQLLGSLEKVCMDLLTGGAVYANVHMECSSLHHGSGNDVGASGGASCFSNQTTPCQVPSLYPQLGKKARRTKPMAS